MNSLKTLIRTLVRTYYEASVGFFLVVIFIAFVLMRSNEHIALATSIANSISLTLSTLVLWSIYYLKAYVFMYRILNKKSFLFIRHLVFEPYTTQFLWLFLINLMIGMPAWAYAGFISIFNFNYGTWLNFSVMMGFLLALNATISFQVLNLLKHPIKELKLGLWTKYASTHLTISYPFWYIRHLFIHEPMLLFLSKIGSLLVLIGSYHLFETDIYDWRLLGVGILFSFMLNSMLVYNYHEFNIKNHWILNLPIKQSKIISSSLITTSILFIPEIITILFRHPQRISYIEELGLITFSFSLAYFLKSSLLWKPIVVEDYGKRLFSLMIIFLFIIMYSIPLILVNLVLIGASVFIMTHYYKLLLKAD